jgi:hypothetical protein
VTMTRRVNASATVEFLPEEAAFFVTVTEEGDKGVATFTIPLEEAMDQTVYADAETYAAMTAINKYVAIVEDGEKEVAAWF